MIYGSQTCQRRISARLRREGVVISGADHRESRNLVRSWDLIVALGGDAATDAELVWRRPEVILCRDCQHFLAFIVYLVIVAQNRPKARPANLRIAILRKHRVWELRAVLGQFDWRVSCYGTLPSAV